MKRHTLAAVLTLCAGLAACGESGRNNSAWSTAKPVDGSPAAATVSAPTSASATSSGKGIGPVVDNVELASLDESKESMGATLFQAKCTACHKIEEKYIGPALAGVTERRQPEWILNMILNPEVMVQQDPTAKALIAQYIAPMANQHLTREEAECVLVYFREHDEEAAESAGEDGVEEAGHEASSASVSAADGH